MSVSAEIRFIPATMSRPVGDGIIFRPVRSWHSNTYAGERLEIFRGDRSGCMDVDVRGRKTCNIPYTVTHRLYWHEGNPQKTISAFLSYPDAMGCSDGQYFWEVYGIGEDVDRYFGDEAEADMEAAIREFFSRAKSTGTAP